MKGRRDGEFFFFKQKTAYEMRISDWSSDVCSSDLDGGGLRQLVQVHRGGIAPDASVQIEIEIDAAPQDQHERDAVDQGIPVVGPGPVPDPEQEGYRKRVV